MLICPRLRHSVVCKLGSGHFYLHNTLRDVIASICTEAGLFTLIEQIVDKFLIPATSTKPAKQARLDVVAHGGPTLEHFFLDATVRNPFATWLKDGPTQTDGFACLKGDESKLKRYKCSDGTQATPCSAETFGRLSPTFIQFLHKLDSLATNHATRIGIHPPRYYQKWLSLINVAINKALCRAFEESVCPHSAPCANPLSNISKPILPLLSTTNPNPNRHYTNPDHHVEGPAPEFFDSPRSDNSTELCEQDIA